MKLLFSFSFSFSFSCLLLLLTVPAPAAELQSGEWSGTYAFADDDVLRVKYLVEAETDGSKLKITMNAAEVEIIFSDIRRQKKQLNFRMNPGEVVDCLLTLGEGGTYKGECSSVVDPAAAQTIKVFMRPPQVETQDEATGGNKAVESDAAVADAEKDES